MSKEAEQARKDIHDRILQRRAQTESEQLAHTLNVTLANAEKLLPWEQDFAFRSSIEFNTDKGWSSLYNVVPQQIRRAKHRKAFQDLKQTLLYDIRKYTVNMRTALVREAMGQYLSIFRMRETQFNVETKRKAAKELIEMFGFGVVGASPENSISNEVSFDSFSDVDAENLEVSVDSLKDEVAKLEKLSAINQKVNRYLDDDIPEVVSTVVDDANDVRRVTRGFNKEGAKPIIVE